MGTLRLAAVALLALSACPRPKTPVVVDAGAPVSPVVESAPAVPLKLFTPDAWNVARALLFQREREVSHPACLFDGGCLQLNLAQISSGYVSRRIEAGGDEPLPFIGHDVTFLAGRGAAIREALANISPAQAEQFPVEAVWLQNDLWERWDSLGTALRHCTERCDAYRALLEPLAAAITSLALPEATLRALPGQHTRYETEFPELAGLFTRWTEVRTHHNERRDEPLLHHTRHAQLQDLRMVFRVLVDAPATLAFDGGEGGHAVPPGSKLALVASPLAISRERTLEAVPLVSFVELRATDVVDATRPLSKLSFEVFETSRTGALHRLAPDAPVPAGATCMSDPSSRLPLRATCITCHAGPARVSGAFAHGANLLSLERDATAAARAVIEARLKSERKLP